MLEAILIYVIFCYMLIKFKIVKATKSNYIKMVVIGLSLLALLFMLSRYYAFIDLTKSATVKSKQIAVRTPVGGDITKVYVTHNQKVKKGDLLYTIDTYRYDLQMESLTSDLKAQTEAYETIRKDLIRLEQLHSGGFVSDSELASKRSELLTQKKSVSAVEQQIDDLQWKIEKTFVLAPVDGVVNIVYLSSGQYIPENRISSLIIFTDEKFLEVRIPDQVYSYLEVGAFAEFYVNAHPGKIFRGRVQSITQSTGEAQAALTGVIPQNVSTLVARGQANIGRTVVIEFIEPENIEIPVGTNGQAWITVRKDNFLLSILDILAGAILRAGAIEAYLGALK